MTSAWTLDILHVINKLGKRDFFLTDIYAFEKHLSGLHPKNKNIKAKIRQQLQVLRDAGMIEFIAKGKYKLKAGLRKQLLRRAKKAGRTT